MAEAVTWRTFTSEGPRTHRYEWVLLPQTPDSVDFVYRCRRCGHTALSRGFSWIGPVPTFDRMLAQFAKDEREVPDDDCPAL